MSNKTYTAREAALAVLSRVKDMAKEHLAKSMTPQEAKDAVTGNLSPAAATGIPNVEVQNDLPTDGASDRPLKKFLSARVQKPDAEEVKKGSLS